MDKKVTIDSLDSCKISSTAKTVEPTNPLECAVCLQSCVHPVQLECKHIFCFLCVKGVAHISKRCPMCRREIPPEFLEHPNLVQGPLELVLASEVNSCLQDEQEEKPETEELRWFYEGRNGWWEYDLRTRLDLEQNFKEGIQSCELLIAGFLYTVDFQNMFQYRRNEPNRRRKIRRDLLSNVENWKGVAGLRLTTSNSTESPSTENANVEQLASGLDSLSLSSPQDESSQSN